MPQVVFEPTIPVFEREKTALDHAAILICPSICLHPQNNSRTAELIFMKFHVREFY
jgi:hypothetical protein